jgi:hypothetical protein
MTSAQDPLRVVERAQTQVGVPSWVVVGIVPDAGPLGQRCTIAPPASTSRNDADVAFGRAALLT